MPRFSPAALLTSLERSLAPGASLALCVAYSGGLDSTALLHAAVRIASEQPRYRVRAVHVDHRLHPDSGRWAAQCAAVASALDVTFVPLVVDARRAMRDGLEASARQARYAALRGVLMPGETLLTAHHADDQLETMLLALMRGAGVRGLSAMPRVQPFGAAWLARPLLDFTRAQIERWVCEEGLSWIADPSNENVGLDRNYVRHRVLPALQARWPAAARSAGRSARHLAEAGHLIDALAAMDAGPATRGACLSVAALASLEPARRRSVLRYWIRQQGVRAPSTRKLAAIEHDMLMARDDRVPCALWDDAELRRHRGLLYCLPRQGQLAAGTHLQWQTSGPLPLPAQLGRLRLIPAGQGGLAPGRLRPTLEVRFRAGGELFRPAGDAHHRKLKKLLQSSDVLPWWRDRLPLIYCDSELVAVADLWTAHEFAAAAGEPGMAVLWEDGPRIRAERG